MLKGTTGRGPLRPSCTCTRGQGPLDPFRRYCKLGKKDCFRQFRWGYEKFVGFWPKKARKILRGRASFPPGVFPDFHRMLCIREGDFVAGPEAIMAPSRVYFLSTADVCFFVRPSSFRLCGVQGDHPPGQVWAESPAYPLCWPCNRYFFTLHTDAVKILEEAII